MPDLGEAPYVRVARCFHEAYEELAPRFGYETRRESAVPWEDVPPANRRLMVATINRLVGNGVIEVKEVDALRAVLKQEET